MKFNLRCLLVFFSLLSLSCAGISYNEYQDAETLGIGNGAITVGTFPGLEGRLQFPLSDNTDAGFSLWSVNIINPSRNDKDIGIKLGLKHQLSNKNSKVNWAIFANVFGYHASYSPLSLEKPARENIGYSALGLSPGLIVSLKINKRSEDIDQHFSCLLTSLRSMYAGLKLNYLYSSSRQFYSFDSTEITSVKNEIFVYPFIGISAGDDLQEYIEAAYLTHNLALDDNFKNHLLMTVGIKYIFSF